MIKNQEIDSTKLNITMKLIKDEVLSRGWQIELPYISSPLAFIDKGNGEILRIFSTTPPTTSYAAACLANDKLATHNLLEAKGFPLMNTVLVEMGDTSFKDAVKLLDESKMVVVKPIDAGHGNGITTHINNRQDLITAIEYAKKFTKNSNSVIVQEMYMEPIDLRILCIDGEAIAGVVRQPARVTGDGLHTIAELIQKENIEKRGVPYRTDLAFIDFERAMQFVGVKSKEIPPKDEVVTVLGTANVGSGGEAIDCTDTLPKWLKTLACDIAAAAALPVCGVDFMVKIIPTATSTKSALFPVITEINKCPSLGLHHKPTSGMPRNVTKNYVDYLAKI